MKKLNSIVCVILILSVGFLLAGCPARETTSEPEAERWGMDFGPEWAQNPPQEDGLLFGVANARSRNLNIALQRANLQATNQLAQEIGQSLRSWQEDYQQEMGDATSSEILSAFESLTERVVDEELRGVSEVERAVQRDEDGIYEAWVLVNLDLDEMANQFSEMERLETEFSREQARENLRQQTDN